MTERKDAQPGSETPAPETANALPKVEAPPLSPAGESPAPAGEPPLDTATAATALRPPAKLWHRHPSLLAAAMVALAAGFGAVVGAFASSVWTPASHDVAGLEQRRAMQQSIAHLSRQVVLLKANLERASKAEHTEIASLSKHLKTKPAADITGSIRQPAAAPVPLPRPAPRIAAAPSRPRVVTNWSIRDVRDGYVYVESNGDIYQVVPGAPLPGLGPVEAITRRDGHWVVVTPRGLIVAQRDRRFFE